MIVLKLIHAAEYNHAYKYPNEVDGIIHAITNFEKISGMSVRIIFLSVITLGLFSACNDTPKEAPPITPVAPSPVQPPAPQVPDSTITTVSGKVVEIKPGKDGYTAKLETDGKKTYFVTVSHSNLIDHSQYRTVAVGETITVEGEAWKMGNEEQVTVRSIR